MIEARTHRDITTLSAAAHAVLDAAASEYHPQAVYALFSGGYDSLVTTHLTAARPDFAGVLHIDTTIGLPETQAYVRATCAAQGWPLTVLRPHTTYAMLAVKHGLPGPALHGVCYQYLKERPLEHFLSTIPRTPGASTKVIGLAAGARSTESVRRMGHSQVVRLEKTRLWINPIHDWSGAEVQDYLEAHALPRNEVKDLLHISGECFCGAFAAQNELRDLEIYYPAFAAELGKYEELVRVARTIRQVTIPPEAARWGWGRGIPLQQIELFPMCHFCREAAA